MSVDNLIDDMLEMQRQLGDTTVRARVNPSYRPAVIDMRRRFATAVLAVSSAIENDGFVQGQPELAAEFRHRFSEMRTKIAVFQAKWPAVLLDNHDPEFDRSAHRLRAENQAFTDWARKALKR